MLTTDMDGQKNPPVTVRQLDMFYLPDNGAYDAVLSFNINHSMYANQPHQGDKNEEFKPLIINNNQDDIDEDLNNLIFLSRQEASTTHRQKVKNNH